MVQYCPNQLMVQYCTISWWYSQSADGTVLSKPAAGTVLY
jgi:hypothetical protein